MTKTNVSCPRCSSNDLYKFGHDQFGHQKYQCKKCKRQFAPETLKENLNKESMLTVLNVAKLHFYTMITSITIT